MFETYDGNNYGKAEIESHEKEIMELINHFKPQALNLNF